MNWQHICQIDASPKSRIPGVPMLLIGAMVAIAGGAVPASSQAQTTPVCGPSVRKEIVATLARAATDAERLVLEKRLHAKFSYCADSDSSPKDELIIAAQDCSANLVYSGNTYYEEMPCCGYDPQRRQFACPVKIKQAGYYGREYVYHCVASPSGFVPVGFDSVNVDSELYGNNPPWQFAVIAAAVENLAQVYPLNGQTRTVRSILSFSFKPTDCNYQPTYGNVIEYPIRLDQ